MPHAQTDGAVSINISAKAKQRDIIDQAASRLGLSRPEYMMETVGREAEEVLLVRLSFAQDNEDN